MSSIGYYTAAKDNNFANVLFGVSYRGRGALGSLHLHDISLGQPANIKNTQ